MVQFTLSLVAAHVTSHASISLLVDCLTPCKFGIHYTCAHVGNVVPLLLDAHPTHTCLLPGCSPIFVARACGHPQHLLASMHNHLNSTMHVLVSG